MPYKFSVTSCKTISDLDDMLALSQSFPEDNLHVTDLPYRLCSWALDEPANTCLWRDQQGRLLGWAVMQTPFWVIDYALDPKIFLTLHHEILAWADRRAQQAAGTPSARPAWYVCVFDDQAERARDLEAAGFASQADVGEDSWSKVSLRRAASLPLPPLDLPAGFTVRSLAGESEAGAYVELHRAAFESKNMTLDWRERTLRHPVYRGDLDIVIEAPNGRLAAFCVGWLNARAGFASIGQIEPLGCHPDFQGLGLGRAVLLAGLHRLAAAGAETIHVETDNFRDAAFALYESAGFQVERDVLMYRKEYPGT